MHLLHKNRENFCLQTVFPMGPISKMTPFWPTFWISELNPDTRTPLLRFSIFENFRFSKKVGSDKKFWNRFFASFLALLFTYFEHKIFTFFRPTSRYPIFFIPWTKFLRFFQAECAKLSAGSERCFWAVFFSCLRRRKPGVRCPNRLFHFRTPTPKKRTFQKKSKKSKKRTFSKKVGSQKWNPFLSKKSRFSARNGPEKVKISKKFSGPIFRPVDQTRWVEFENPKSGSKWGHFWKRVGWSKFFVWKILLIFPYQMHLFSGRFELIWASYGTFCFFENFWKSEKQKWHNSP